MAIKITHIKWDGYKIGVALHKLKEGKNKVLVTAKDKNGELLYPLPIILDKEEAIDRYGVSIINKNHLQGIWIPLRSL